MSGNIVCNVVAMQDDASFDVKDHAVNPVFDGDDAAECLIEGNMSNASLGSIGYVVVLILEQIGP